MIRHIAALLASNSLLALYPIMIKWYPHVTTLVQTVIRIIAIICCSFFFTSPHIIQLSLFTPAFIAIGIVNIVHIYASYAAYQHLNAGIATGLFYTYPIFIVLLSTILLNESITFSTAIGLLTCFIGVIILQYNKMADGHDKLGYFYIIIASITEAIIILFYKIHPMSNAFDRLFTLYALSLIPAAIAAFTITAVPSISELLQLSGFHIVCGFGGYLLRLFAVDLPTVTFSLLSYSQIIFAFIYGWYWLGETVTLTDAVGIATLIGGISQIHL